MKLSSLHFVKVLVSKYAECLSNYSFPRGDFLLGDCVAGAKAGIGRPD